MPSQEPVFSLFEVMLPPLRMHSVCVEGWGGESFAIHEKLLQFHDTQRRGHFFLLLCQVVLKGTLGLIIVIITSPAYYQTLNIVPESA